MRTADSAAVSCSVGTGAKATTETTQHASINFTRIQTLWSSSAVQAQPAEGEWLEEEHGMVKLHFVT
jgi:hypothetical protein